jgi:CBS domain-containing protein
MTETLADVLAFKGNAVHTVSANDSVLDAARRMHDRGAGALLVVRDGQLFGIISERDILERLVVSERAAAGTPVAAVMSRLVLTVPSSTSVADAMALLSLRGHRRLPVVDGGKLAGLVSMRDLNDWAVRDRQADAEQLRERFAVHGASNEQPIRVDD